LLAFEAGLSAERIFQDLNDLVWRLRPTGGCPVNFFQRVNNVGIVQRDIGLAQGSALTSIEGRIPLFILIAKPDDRDIAFLDQRSDAQRIDFRGLVVAPEIFVGTAEHVASSIAAGMMGIGRAEGDIEIVAFGTGNDLLAPIGMNFARKVDVPLHGFVPVIRSDIQAA
jgi:hypothetical protein